VPQPLRSPRSRRTTATATALVCMALLAAAPQTSEASQTFRGASAASASTPRSAVAATTDTTWSDEFIGRAGTAPDRRKWGYNTGGGTNGWGNKELQSYTTSTQNAALDGAGHLVVTARKAAPGSTARCWYGACRYTSARLLTLSRFGQKYGHVEARLKVPAGAGLWPAFWMLDTNVNAASNPASAEIDIMEHVGSEPQVVYGSLHGSRGAAQLHTCASYRLPSRASYASGFHVFSVDWDARHVTFSVDNHPYTTRLRATSGSAWTFDQPMFLVLNLAVGGSWGGTPAAATRFPSTLVVDYVRVRTSATSTAASPASTPSSRPGGCDTGH
jgi:beta-glucanase (GH16 family)